MTRYSAGSKDNVSQQPKARLELCGVSFYFCLYSPDVQVFVLVGLEASEMEEAGSVIHSLPPTSLHGPVSPYPFASLYSPYPYLPYVKEFRGKHEEQDDHLLVRNICFVYDFTSLAVSPTKIVSKHWKYP